MIQWLYVKEKKSTILNAFVFIMRFKYKTRRPALTKLYNKRSTINPHCLEPKQRNAK